MNFILWHNGKELGPYDADALRNSIQSGEVSPKILARHESGTDWKPLELLLPQPHVEKARRPVPWRKLRTIGIVCAIALLAVGGNSGFRKWQESKVEKARLAEKQARYAILAAAVAELKKIESMTQAGVNYAEYSRRVLDCKINLDGILNKLPSDDAPRKTLEGSMRAYIAARNLWGEIITHGGRDEYIELTDKRREEFAEYPRLLESTVLAMPHVQILWSVYAGLPLQVVNAVVTSAENKRNE